MRKRNIASHLELTMMIKTIIVDDEPRAIELLRGYIDRIPQLTHLQSFQNPLEALQYISKNDVDLVFLDVNMPEISGISFIKSLIKKVHIILTTAYSEYAVESYNYDVDDYLLKPISFERFVKAISKIAVEEPQIADDKEGELLFVKTGYEKVKIIIDDIVYLEKDGNYMTYHTRTKKVLTR